MKLTYTVSKAYREQRFVEIGAEIDPTASVEMPADALTPALRAHLLRTVGAPRVPAEFRLSGYAPSYDASGVTSQYSDRITLGEPATDADAPRLLTEDAARWDAAEALRVVKASERAAERERSQEQERIAAEKRREVAELEAARSAAKEAEKAAWVAAHGSDFLRRACAGGYDCQRRYVTERAAAEHPGYVVDFDDRAAWKDRACPSEAALDEAERVGGMVVWLTRPGYETGEAEYWGEGEAVVIGSYLGKYDLVKAL